MNKLFPVVFVILALVGLGLWSKSSSESPVDALSDAPVAPEKVVSPLEKPAVEQQAGNHPETKPYDEPAKQSAESHQSAGVTMSDVVSRPDWRQIPAAEVVESRTSDADAGGRRERTLLVKSSFKYPLVRVVETIRQDATGAEEILDSSAMIADHMIVRVRPGLTPAKVALVAQQNGLSIRRQMAAPDSYLVSIPEVTLDALPQALASFQQEVNAVVYAEPDYVVFTLATTPNDARFGQLWGLNQGNDADIDAPEAWDLSQGSSNTLVAVIDTGLDYSHEDLSANVWRNPGDAPNGLDDDGNGFIDDTYGWDFYNNDSDPFDDHYHGTHCAGIIGAVGNNATGVVGVNWSANLMALKFMGADGSGASSDAIEAIYYATRRGVRLTSNSWGGGSYLQSMKDAIDQAGTSNILFITAAGNFGRNNDAQPTYPAAYNSQNLIAVAATDSKDILANFSNFGRDTVHLGAPGEGIISTVPATQGKYASLSGTSMAAPHVAGAAALLYSYLPGLTAAQVKQRILDNVDPIPTLNGISLSGGRLNLYRTLSAVPPLQPPAVPTGLNATPSTNGMQLAWADVATNEASYLLERRSGSSGFDLIATLAADTTSTLDTNVFGGVTYTYRIKARNTAGDSAYSSEASATIPGAADAWDPADDAGSGATALTVGTNEASHGPHTLSGTDLHDWFAIPMQQGATYDLNAIGGSGDTYAELFADRAATQLLISDDDSGGGLMFRIEYLAASSVTNFLRVRSFDPGGDAAYYLKYISIPASNRPPEISITSPSSNTLYQSPASIIITASAIDPDGTISDVKFFNGATLLSTDTVAPYAHTWSGVAAGDYTVRAVATDDAGVAVTSAPVAIAVNAQPVVSLTSPTNGSVFVQGATISVAATASDTDGSISQVAFYDGASLLNTDSSSPFGFTWTNAAVGSHAISAVASDDRGGIRSSSTSIVSVIAAQPVLSVSTTNINLQVLVGESLASGSFTVANIGSGTLNYTITESNPWLSVSPTNGSSAGVANTHTVTYSTAGLATGTYSGEIVISTIGDISTLASIHIYLSVVDNSLSSGLMAYFPFNGDTYDYSGFGNHGSLHNASFTNGTFDQALSFTGSHMSHVRVLKNASIEPQEAISIAFWCKSSTVEGYLQGTLLRKAAPWQSGYLIRSAPPSSRILTFLHFLTSGTRGYESIYGQVLAQEWVHIAASYAVADGCSRLYLNGQLIATNAYNAPLEHTSDLFIGGDGADAAGGGFWGVIDEVRIYNRALSSNEVWQLYGGGSASISGTISYSGSQAGQIVIVAGSYTNKIASPGPYSIINLPAPGAYNISAYLDINGNNRRDYDEPAGQYYENPVNLISDRVNVNVELVDVVTEPITSLRIKALIDGPSRLIINSNGIRWYHWDWTAVPGRHDGANEPTTINGYPWYPSWLQPGENRNYEAYSSYYSDLNLQQFLGAKNYIITAVQARTPVGLWLSSESNETAEVNLEYDDLFQGGSDYYEVIITAQLQTSTVRSTISGVVNYDGLQTGRVVIVAGSYTNKINSPGAFALSNLPTRASYVVSAYRDVNGNNLRDATEPFGQNASNPIFLTNDVSGVNIQLADPSPSSLMISGQIGYSGSYAGPIVVSLSSSGGNWLTGHVYVAKTGSDSTGNGSSTSPFASIQRGINAALNDQVIVVAPGTYNEKLVITNKAVQIISMTGPENTIIRGSALDTVIFIGSGASNTVIKGFKVTGGTGKPSPSSYGNDYYGGGINCRVSALISDCIIDGNGWGTPRSSSGTFGGAIYSVGGHLKVVNCLIFNNFAWASGGATLTEGGTIEIERCTIYGNDSTQFFGYQGGLGLANGGGLTVNSSIVWGNGGDEIGAFSSPYNAGTRATVSFCNIEGGASAGGIPTFTIGSGNINANPQFVNTSQTNYSLSAGSPCINAGDPGLAQDPDSTRADMGYLSARYQNGGDFSASIIINNPGNYAFSNLVANLNYTVSAYRDINGNGGKDAFEPQGSYAFNPIFLTNSVTNANITLVEPDTDGDGLSDAYEMGYGRYQIVNGSFTWDQAKADAEATGGHLATITSAEEWTAILDVVGISVVESTDIFLGGTDEGAEGVWSWVTGEAWGYTRWHPGEPNNMNGGEDYLHGGGWYKQLWNDHSTNHQANYLFEIGWYTSPNDADHDDDGLLDGDEVNNRGTDPTRADTDGDGLNDGAEVDAGTNPLLADSDSDGLSDYYEVITKPCLDPLDADTDGDGASDADEEAAGSDPCSVHINLFSISGEISYDGSMTGAVVVTASSLSIPKNDLLAFYPFNGNADDESGNGHDGVVHGAALAPDRKGDSLGAFQFSGNQWIDLGNAEGLNAASSIRSLMAWVKFDDLSSDQEIISKSGVSRGAELLLFNDPYDAQGFGLCGYLMGQEPGAPDFHLIHPVENFNTEDWFHIAMVYEGPFSNAYLYVNGLLVDGGVASLIWDSGDSLILGSWSESAYPRYFSGKIDDVMVFNRALSSNEVGLIVNPVSYVQRADSLGNYQISNILSGVDYTLSAFMDCDGNGILDDGEPRGEYALNPLYLTNNATGIDIELTVPLTGWTVRATHKLSEYYSPGTNTVECEVFYPTNKSLIALGWAAGLPSGWNLVSAVGDGEPWVNSSKGEILFSSFELTNNPIRFRYNVAAPSGQNGPKEITGAVKFLFNGQASFLSRQADPDPLVVNSGNPYHSSDYRNPKWVIDLQEANRTLSYWRSGGYGVRPGTVDGYAPNETSRNGRRHKADYQDPAWEIDGEEALRIIGYWFAGGYHPDPAGVDGYAPGSQSSGGLGIMNIGDISVSAIAPSTYKPGRQVTIRASLSYTNDILGLLWKPILPNGWNILSVSANGGTPELFKNEILFTSKLPPSPLQITYVCSVPEGMAGDALIQTDVQMVRQGSANPQSLLGLLSPSLLQLDSDGDGLPNWVETGTGVFRSSTDTGTNPNNPDTDGDGVLDGQEVPAGTNPNESTSVFAVKGLGTLSDSLILNAAADSSPLQIQWSSVAGKTYYIVRSTNLIDGYSVIRSNILATPPLNTFIDSLATNRFGIYSIGVE